MPNPTSQPIKVKEDSRRTANPLDFKDVIKFMQRLQELSLYWARIKEISVDHTDEYIADLYHKKSTIEADAVYRGVKIYQPNVNFKHVVDAWVECYLDDNLIGLITPRRLPEGVGRCKALILLDDSNPGTPDWGYFAFQ